MGIVLRLLGIALTCVVVGAVVRTRTAHRDYAMLDLDPSPPNRALLCLILLGVAGAFSVSV